LLGRDSFARAGPSRSATYFFVYGGLCLPIVYSGVVCSTDLIWWIFSLMMTFFLATRVWNDFPAAFSADFPSTHSFGCSGRRTFFHDGRFSMSLVRLMWPTLAGVLGHLLSLPPFSSLAEAFCLTSLPPALLSRRALAISIARALHNSIRALRRVPSRNVLYSMAVARLRKYARDDRRLGALLRRGSFAGGRFSLPPILLVPSSAL